MKSKLLRHIALALLCGLAFIPAGCGGSGNLEMEEEAPDAPVTEDPADMEVPPP